MVLILSKLTPSLLVTCALASCTTADYTSSLARQEEASSRTIVPFHSTNLQEEASSRTIAPFHSTNLQEEASSRTIAPFHSTSLQKFYDFFSSRYTILRFILINISQYLFITIGWVITATVWSLIKGDDLSKITIDFPSIGDFLIDDQSGLANIGIGMGSAIFAVGGWTLLASYGQKSALDSRTAYNYDVDAYNANERIGNPELLSQDFYAPTDATFSWQGIAKQTAINTVLVTSFVSFWLFCSWLPVSSSRRSYQEDSWGSSQEDSWGSYQDDSWGGGTAGAWSARGAQVADSIAQAQRLYV